jgi:hypothetical protein
MTEFSTGLWENLVENLGKTGELEGLVRGKGSGAIALHLNLMLPTPTRWFQEAWR